MIPKCLKCDKELTNHPGNYYCYDCEVNFSCPICFEAINRKDLICDKCNVKCEIAGRCFRLLRRPNYKCRFCNDWTKPTYDFYAWESFECKSCKTNFYLRNTKPPIEYLDIYTQIGKRYFQLSIYNESMNLWEIFKTDECDDPAPILIFSDLPKANITPQNIIKKIKTYIIFS